jgi:hypothetical protein
MILDINELGVVSKDTKGPDFGMNADSQPLFYTMRGPAPVPCRARCSVNTASNGT